MQMPGGHLPDSGLTESALYEAKLRQSSPVTIVPKRQHQAARKKEAKGLSFLLVLKPGLEPIQMQMPGGHLPDSRSQNTCPYLIQRNPQGQVFFSFAKSFIS